MKKFKEFINELHMGDNKKKEPLDVPLPPLGIKIGSIVTLRGNYDAYGIPDIKLQLLKKVMLQSVNNTAKVVGIPNSSELFISNDDGVTTASIWRSQVMIAKGDY